MNLVPEENLGVVVLSNRDWNSLVWMLSYDCLDAYLAAAEHHWTADKKWDHWLQLGGPNAGDRDARAELQKLKESRVTDTKPSLPLAAYAGKFKSMLYADLEVFVADERLAIKFGSYEATLDHWERDTFYGHAVIEPFLDWIVRFDITEPQTVQGLEIVNVGWKEPDERFLFTRRPE
jgi:hypothetical protein